jgi:hypothetical protein
VSTGFVPWSGKPPSNVAAWLDDLVERATSAPNKPIVVTLLLHNGHSVTGALQGLEPRSMVHLRDDRIGSWTMVARASVDSVQLHDMHRLQILPAASDVPTRLVLARHLAALAERIGKKVGDVPADTTDQQRWHWHAWAKHIDALWPSWMADDEGKRAWASIQAVMFGSGAVRVEAGTLVLGFDEHAAPSEDEAKRALEAVL